MELYTFIFLMILSIASVIIALTLSIWGFSIRWKTSNLLESIKVAGTIVGALTFFFIGIGGIVHTIQLFFNIK